MKQNPPLNLIASFLAFSESPSMVEAAKKIQVSQPALTSHLQAFQEYFPQSLFTMQGRKKVLTGFGLELQKMLKGRFHHLEADLRFLQQSYAESQQAVIRIAGRAEILSSLAGRYQFPGSVIFQPMDGERAVEELLNRECDLAISNHLKKAGPLHSQKLFVDHLSFWIPKAWKIKGLDWRSRPRLSYKESDSNIDKILAELQLQGSATPRIVLQDWRRLAELVGEGFGWCLGPDRFAQEISSIELMPVPKELAHATQFYLLYRKEMARTDWMKQFQIANFR